MYENSLVQFLLHVVVELLSCIRIFATPMDYSRPGSSVHEILQARILARVGCHFLFRGSSFPRDGTPISSFSRWILYC